MTDKSKALAELRESISQLDLPLKATATNLVFGKGNPNTDILFIGEAPGKFEDLQGIPFVGTAGKLLDEMLNKINLTINDIYIANILKYRPPNNREPQPDEISAHTPFLVEQIKIIKPKIIVTLQLRNKIYSRRLQRRTDEQCSRYNTIAWQGKAHHHRRNRIPCDADVSSCGADIRPLIASNSR